MKRVLGLGFLALTNGLTWTTNRGEMHGSCSKSNHIHAAMCEYPLGCTDSTGVQYDEGSVSIDCPSGKIGIRTVTCTDGTLTVDETACKSKADLRGSTLATRTNSRAVLKSRLSIGGKAVRKAHYDTMAARKTAREAALRTRHEYMVAQQIGGDSWKHVVIEDNEDFEGYTDEVLAKRQNNKIRYRVAPRGLRCSLVTPDITLSREDGLDTVDPEHCVSIGVEDEPGVIRIIKNGETFVARCNNQTSQTGLEAGDEFTCRGRVWDIGSITTEPNIIIGCMDETRCNYNKNATVPYSCLPPLDGICETCSGETDGTGYTIDNDADDDTVCDADEVVGCYDNTRCNYNQYATDVGDCLRTLDGICETCSGETNGTGTIIDNDADNDNVCDADEVVGCQDKTRCNYDISATDAGNCLRALDGICETCSGETNGTGTIIDNDADNDNVCNADEVIKCWDIHDPVEYINAQCCNC